MYKMIGVEDLVKINKQFDSGRIVNEGSLRFALSNSKYTKDWTKQLAYFVRAILIDHVFEEGNKRTASALMMAVLEEYKIAYDPEKVDSIIIEIIKKNITSIDKIRRMIKDVTR